MFKFTGNEILDFFLAIAGNAFIAIAVYRALGHYARDEKGMLMTHILVSIVVAGLIYFPTETVGIFKGLWSLLTQGHL